MAITHDSGAVQNQGFPPDVPAFKLGPSHAGSDSLDDQAAFQLCDRPDDDDKGPARWAAGVDLSAEADELDVEPVQLIEYFGQMRIEDDSCCGVCPGVAQELCGGMEGYDLNAQC